MQSKFYVVQKNGIPAVWQVDPSRIGKMLKRNPGFISLQPPSETRTEALVQLRQLFPGCRPLKVPAIED